MRKILLLLMLFTHLTSQNTNTYLGPNQKLPQELVRIQVLVYNDPNPKGVTITNVEFDGQNIPLKPRDIYGYRGQASFQKRSGKYKLIWKVNRSDNEWPRTISHEEEVIISPRDLWIQITIIGNEASIS